MARSICVGVASTPDLGFGCIVGAGACGTTNDPCHEKRNEPSADHCRGGHRARGMRRTASCCNGGRRRGGGSRRRGRGDRSIGQDAPYDCHRRRAARLHGHRRDAARAARARATRRPPCSTSATDKDGEDLATRPITFVFNGGPGSSAAWLHIGGLGPRRLALDEDGELPEPPARLVDNAETWLRFTDLVFVDPVGTGFSRAVATGRGERRRRRAPLLGHQERSALSCRVHPSLPHPQRSLGLSQISGRRELRRFSRGRARGRSCLLRAGIELNGAILISPVIEYTLNLGNDYLNVMPWVTFVPSYAATAFHYGKYRGEGDEA